MKNWNKIGTTLALIHASLHALDSNSTTTPPPPSFPLYDEQEWYTRESYLLWKPFQADIDYGSKNNFTETLDSTGRIVQDDNVGKTKKPKFDWSSGVRVALGKYLSSHDSWDISGIGTYLFGEASDKSHAFEENNDFFSPSWIPVDLRRFVSPTSNRVYWKMNYFTLDLVLGREFLMTPHLVVHPYFGIRAPFIYQDYINRGKGTTHPFDTETDIVTYHTHLKNNFWGVGPRVGADFSFEFATHWSILGNFSAAFFWGQMRMKEKLRGKELTVDSLFGDSESTFMFRLRDKDQVVRTNIEGYVGLGWEKWVHGNKIRLAPSIVFEGSVWFAMNQLPQLTFSASPGRISRTIPTMDATRHQGHLGLIGATVNFQVDF